MYYGTVHMQCPTSEFEFEALLVYLNLSTRLGGRTHSTVFR